MGKKKIDLTGLVIGSFTVLSEVDKPQGATQTGAYWLVRCECGEERIKTGSALRSRGGSCGCKKRLTSSKTMKEMMLKKHGTIKDRFLSRFTAIGDDDCWEWNAQKDKDGYGVLPTNGAPIRAHRFSIKHFKGIDPTGFVVCHSCDNPSCVNPSHLFIGKPVDNVNDMLHKGRDMMVGSRNNKAKLKETDVIEILKSKDGNDFLSAKYNVSKSTIKRIRARTLWRHINV